MALPMANTIPLQPLDQPPGSGDSSQLNSFHPTLRSPASDLQNTSDTSTSTTSSVQTPAVSFQHQLPSPKFNEPSLNTSHSEFASDGSSPLPLDSSLSSHPTDIVNLKSDPLSSPSPAPPPSNTLSNLKKFKASSLSVNKKFLSQSAASDPKSGKNSFIGSPRLSSLNPSINPSPLASGPRLLTGKISANSSILNASGSGTSGWAKTPLMVPTLSLGGKSPEPNHAVPPTAMSISSVPLSTDDNSSAGPPKTGLNGFLHHSSQQSQLQSTSKPTHPINSSPWGKFANAPTNGMNNLVNDFPTAQEVANHNKLRAQSMAAAVAARDKAVQDRAAASAAYNQQLLQTLDGFRGTHLDPNASHWDEMEDEDDMFGEVVEFGDGTQYKVTEAAPAPTNLDQIPPAAPEPSFESSKPVKKEERFNEDYDRTSQPIDGDHQPPFLRGRAELKSLFNERLGKFEPYSGKPLEKPKDNSAPVQLLQRQRDASNDGHLSHQNIQPPNNTMGDLSSAKPSSGHEASNVISNSQPTRSQSDNLRDCTLLPSDKPRDMTCRTSLSQPLSSPKTSLSPSETYPELNPVSSNTASTKLPIQANIPSEPSNPPAPDLEALHRTEMMSAAERARKRRQQEEDAREAERQRAKQKALEMEAKLVSTAAAAAVAATNDPVTAAPPKSPVRPSDLSKRNITNGEASRPGTAMVPADRKDADSWRARPIEKTLNATRPSTSALSSERPPLNLVRRPILPRPPPTSTDLIQQSSRLVGDGVPNVNPPPASDASVSLARAPSALPPQEEAFKNRDEGSSRPTSWKSQISMALSSNRPARLSELSQSTLSTPKQISLVEDTDKNPRSSAMDTDRWQRLKDHDGTARSDPRQRPPHMSSTPEQPTKPRAIPTPRSTEAQTSKSQIPVSGLDTPVTALSKPTVPLLTRDTTSASSSSFQTRVTLQDKKLHAKLPDMSQLDTVMSRIKGVLEADKEARAQEKAEATATLPLPEPSSARTILRPTSSSFVTKPTSTPDTIASSTGISPKLNSNPPNSLDVKGKNPTVGSDVNRSSTGAPSKPLSPMPRLVSALKPVLQTAPTSGTTSSQPARHDRTSTIPPPPLTSALSNPSEKKPTSVRKAARFDLSPQERHVHSVLKSNNSPSLPSSSRPLTRELSFVNRDPAELFDVTREVRPPSPEPAWKAYPVKLSHPVIHNRRASPHVLKAFWNPLTPARVNILTWDPPLPNLSPRTLSRDDLLFRRKYIRGNVVSNVVLPRLSFKDLAALCENNVKSTKTKGHSIDHNPSGDNGNSFMRGRGRGSSASQPVLRGRGRGRADGTMSWRRPLEEPAPVLIPEHEVLPTTPEPIAQTLGSNQSTNSVVTPSRKTKSKLPEGSKVAFNRPHNVTSLTTSTASGMFMVNSEITGEVLHTERDLKEPDSCTNPDRATSVPLTPRNRSNPPPVSLTPPSSNMHSIQGAKGSTSPWTKSPLAFSVLDSHTKNVWSQPDDRLTAKPPPSGKIGNSLEGIPDDFVAALPRTLNDFNVEDGSARGSVKDEQTPFGGIESSSYLSPRASKKAIASSPDHPPTQAGTTGAGRDTQSAPSGQEDRPLPSGQGQPAYNPSNAQISSNQQPGSVGQGYSGSFPSPAAFQVPPGYQLVPIGSVPNPPPAQYNGLPSVYSGQSAGPWSPSLPPQQPNDYARSPQLYSLNANYPSPIQSNGGFSTVNQTPTSAGLNKTPGPIAPRGSRTSNSGGMLTLHHGRPSSDNNFVPAVGRNGPNYPIGSKLPHQTSGMAGYPHNSSLDLPNGGVGYASSFVPFNLPNGHAPGPQPLPSQFSSIHTTPGLSQTPFSPSLAPSSNMFPGSSGLHSSQSPQSMLLQSHQQPQQQQHYPHQLPNFPPPPQAVANHQQPPPHPHHQHYPGGNQQGSGNGFFNPPPGSIGGPLGGTRSVPPHLAVGAVQQSPHHHPQTSYGPSSSTSSSSTLAYPHRRT